MESRRKGIWPALTLFFLSPMIGELLSGSAPPVEFFNPFALLVLPALYGSGAILVRELRVRWGKGWPTVFALGAAYGIIEEGLMVKSFFDPNWMDLGLLGSYGRWAGVNWVWSLQLTIYHAVFSIAIPILLVELLFPTRRDERWVGRRGMIGLSLLLLADVLLGFFLLTPYRPPLVPYLLAVVATVVLFVIARRLPAHRGAKRSARVPRPLWFALIGFGATLAFFVIHWALPEFALPVPLTILASVALVVIMAWGGASPVARRRVDRPAPAGAGGWGADVLRAASAAAGTRHDADGQPSRDDRGGPCHATVSFLAVVAGARCRVTSRLQGRC